jgi:hypothetical protein
MKKLFTLLLFSAFFNHPTISAQVCSTDDGLSCQEAIVFCYLDSLDGFTCRLPDTANYAGPTPFCSGGGVPNNTHWLLFVAESDSTSIQITPSNCTVVGGQTGMQAALYTDCSWEDPIYCMPSCTTDTITISFRSAPCRSYYLVLDGCAGSECDYTLEILTGKNTQPRLDSISITAPDSVCYGARLCMSVTASLTCDPEYLWLVDGDTLDAKENSVCAPSPSPGLVEVCVKAFTGRVGDYCDSTDWACDTVLIYMREDTVHRSRETFCYEDRFGIFFQECATPVPPIPGLHKICCIATQPSGCKFPVCKEFYIRGQPTEGTDTIIRCEEEPVILPGHGPVSCGEYVVYLENEGPLGCDTTIVYQVAYIEAEVVILRPECIGGSVCVQVQPFFECQIIKPDFTSTWINRRTGEIVDQGTELLCVDEPGEYCYLIQSEYMGNVCTPKQYCIKVPDLRPNPGVIIGDTVTCLDSASYYVDTPPNQRISDYNWTVSEGEIVSGNRSANVELDLSNVTGDEVELCLTVMTDCGTSLPKCLTIEIAPDSVQAFFDVKQAGDSTYFNANAPGAAGYMWQFGDGATSTERDPVHLYDSPGTYIVQLIVYNQCDRDTFEREVIVMFTATRNPQAGYLNIFPNPSTGKVTAVLKSSGSVTGDIRVRLLDVTGRMHYEQAHPASAFDAGLALDFESFPSGVYLLMVEGEGLRVGHRLVLTGQ